MARRNYKEDSILKSIQNIQDIAYKRKIEVVIKSNGLEDRENPAYYGSLHDNGEYPFSEEATRNISDVIMNDDRMRKHLIDVAKRTNVRRKTSDLDKASSIAGEIASERVVEYILYEMPQSGKKEDGLDLVETGALIDSIGAIVSRKGKRWEV